MLYQRDDDRAAAEMMMMAKRQEHCYTNPSFCQQSEYAPEDRCNQDAADLPPPPQFQMDDLPPPPAILTPQPQYGQSNPGFTGSPETELQQQRPALHHRSIAGNLNRTAGDRYCYIDDPAEEEPSPPPVISHKRYGSLPMGNRGPYRRYEYIQEAPPVHVPRYDYVEQQQLQQRAAPTPAPPPPPPPTQQHQQQQQVMMISPVKTSYRSAADTHYDSLGPDAGAEVNQSHHWPEEDVYARRQISTPKGRYTSVPTQDEFSPPSLPERNDAAFHQQHHPQQQQQQQQQQQRVNQATQRLHEILTTPRKPRKRTQSEALSPIKSPQMQPMLHGVQRNAYTPTHSPSSVTVAGHRVAGSPMHQQQLTPQRDRTLSPSRSVKGPATSTPNKEPISQQQQQQQPSARRCLPLNESGTPMIRRHLEDSQTYGRSPRAMAAYSVAEEAMYVERKKQQHGFYSGVEEAFIARTAVVPPLSPPMSEANTTLVSGTIKSDRKYAPILVVLVGVLTCGLAVYFSSMQGRKYYFDSAFGCGALCALAGASRSLRRTWTGLGLAGLSALSCGGLLLLAGFSPRPGTPLHDVTAGALCGVSLLGAALAFLALVSPRCPFGRHHRVHSWIPAFEP